MNLLFLGLALTGWLYGLAVLVYSYYKLKNANEDADELERQAKEVIRKANRTIEEAKEVMREHRVDKLAGEALTGGDYYD
jgi:hypothetical protein